MHGSVIMIILIMDTVQVEGIYPATSSGNSFALPTRSSAVIVRWPTEGLTTLTDAVAVVTGSKQLAKGYYVCAFFKRKVT